MFDLEKSIKQWRKSLRKNQALEDGYIAELESHLRDEFQNLINSGIKEEEAFEKAVRNIGLTEDIGAEYYKSDTRHSNAKPPWHESRFIPALLNNYIKIAYRNIKRHKGYSIINISGLTIGLACCILILLWVHDELSYDKFHKKVDRIYRVESELNFTGKTAVYPATQATLAQALKNDFPEIENACRIKSHYRILVKNEEKAIYETKFYSFSPSVFEIFSFPFLKGNPGTALDEPSSIVLTEEMGRKYFGKKNPIGQTLEIDGKHIFKVTGVIENIPFNSHLKIDFIVPFKYCEMRGERLDDWGRYDFRTYILLRKGVSKNQFEKKISRYTKKYNPTSETRFLLTSLKNIHLSAVSGTGDIIYIYLFSAIGLIVLCIACTNFINISTARSIQRGKEIGVRKVVGAKRINLIIQLLGESTLISILSFFLALILVQVFLPLFNELYTKHLSIKTVFNFDTALVLTGIIIFTGVISGSYPAFYLSSFKPMDVLKGKMRKSKSESLLKRILITAQFCASTVLIISMIVIYFQMNYMSKRKLGFDKDHLLYLNLPSNYRSSIDVLQTEILKHPNIKGVAASDQIPVDMGNFSTINNWEGKTDDKKIQSHVISIDNKFIDLLDIKMVQGSNFLNNLSTNCILVNEEALRQMEIKSPIGKRINYWNESGIITGIVKNFHFMSLHNRINPLIIISNPKRFRYLLIKINPLNIDATVNYLQNLFTTIAPDSPFEYNFLNNRIENLYQTQKRISIIISCFTLLTIFTSCLGLYGLIVFTAQNRTKEIGVRKVMGASVQNIVLMLSNQFTKWILIANIVAWPIAWYFMNNWLENFAYRIDIELWIFLLAGCTTLIIALLTVSYQAIKVAMANPVDSLRYE